MREGGRFYRHNQLQVSDEWDTALPVMPGIAHLFVSLYTTRMRRVHDFRHSTRRRSSLGHGKQIYA